MVTVRLAISDDERARVERQAEQDGVSVAAWLTAAARQRLRQRETEMKRETARPPIAAARRPIAAEGLAEIWRRCDARQEPELEREPDWEEHLKVSNESRRRGLPEV